MSNVRWRAMEIREDVTNALKPFSSNGHGDSSATPQNLVAVARAAISVVLQHQTEEPAFSAPSFHEIPVDLTKQTYSALVCIYLEAARRDLSSHQFLSYLTQRCALSDPVSSPLGDLFLENKQELRKLLARTANHAPLARLTGVDWRLDYCLSASEDKACKELLYFVGLKTLDSTTPSEGNLEFVCTVEQLQDLVGQLKDACKSVERGLG